MGIFIDYAFYAECEESELLHRLRTLRERIADLPFQQVAEIRRVEPVFDILLLPELEAQGYPLPPAVAKRVRAGGDDETLMVLRHALSPQGFLLLPEDLQTRFLLPARDFVDRTDLWRASDFPEMFSIGGVLTMNRRWILFRLAEAMLRYGYVLAIDPGEGCEPVNIAVSTIRGKGTPVWAGSGFTKTQYAVRFVQTHESICKLLDRAREVGLLYRAQDTCRFYEDRSWEQSAPIVNRETIAATLMSNLLGSAIETVRAAGVDIKVLSSPASHCTNIVQVDKPIRPEEK